MRLHIVVVPYFFPFLSYYHHVYMYKYNPNFSTFLSIVNCLLAYLSEFVSEVCGASSSGIHSVSRSSLGQTSRLLHGNPLMN
jgi:hypothetical protein